MFRALNKCLAWKWGPWTPRWPSSICVTWELVEDAEAWAPPYFLNQTLHFNQAIWKSVRFGNIALKIFHRKSRTSQTSQQPSQILEQGERATSASSLKVCTFYKGSELPGWIGLEPERETGQCHDICGLPWWTERGNQERMSCPGGNTLTTTFLPHPIPLCLLLAHTLKWILFVHLPQSLINSSRLAVGENRPTPHQRWLGSAAFMNSPSSSFIIMKRQLKSPTMLENTTL